MIRISKHVHTFSIRVFMCALKFLTCNVACAPCLFLFQNHKFHIRQKRMPKLLKTQMLAMCIFYCKLHMKVMTTENVMLHLHGKNPCVFAILIIFFFKKEQQRNHYWKDSSRNDGFYNTFAACTGTMKTLLPVDENRHFFAITMGRMKPETRADEGSERCCCCCCCYIYSLQLISG